jgi:hypothetical protein
LPQSHLTLIGIGPPNKCKPNDQLSRTDKRREVRQTFNEAENRRKPKTRRLSVSA